MKIAIIGAGAMGCLYGAKLSASAENEVFLLDVWQDHVDAINKEGLQMEENQVFVPYKNVNASTQANDVGVVELAVVFVKSTLTKLAVESNLAVFGPDTVTLTLQNGLGNIDLISQVIGKKNVIAGTTAHGATMLAPGKIRHAGSGKTVIGELDGKQSDRIMKIAKLLNEATLETEVSTNVVGLVWDKLMVNVGINALTGITRLENGKLIQHRELEELLEKAVLEGKAVAKAKGINLSFHDPVQHTKGVCTATASNKSSMLQDILNKKKTEIEMMNGAIVKEGKALGVETPVNMVLTNLIQFLEKEY